MGEGKREREGNRGKMGEGKQGTVREEKEKKNYSGRD